MTRPVVHPKSASKDVATSLETADLALTVRDPITHSLLCPCADAKQIAGNQFVVPTVIESRTATQDSASNGPRAISAPSMSAAPSMDTVV